MNEDREEGSKMTLSIGEAHELAMLVKEDFPALAGALMDSAEIFIEIKELCDDPNCWCKG